MPKGFTLIELVIVIVILGIIAVVASVSLNPGKSIRLDTAARKVAMDIQYCRSMALSQSKWYGINFQISPANTYTTYLTDGTTQTTLDTVNISGNYGGVILSGVNIEAGTQVEFSPLGVPYTSKSGSAITGNGVVTLGYSGLIKTINITPNTGFISIS